MPSSTYLRVLRLKYHIPLEELAGKVGVSNQQFSRLEHGQLHRTAYQERLVALAISEVILARKMALTGLEQDFHLHKGELLKPMEVEQDEQ